MLKRWWSLARLVWGAWKRLGSESGTTYAAALSYNVLFSLFPLLLLLVSIVGLLLRAPDLQQAVVEAVLDQLPPETNLRGPVEALVSGVSRVPGVAGLISLAGLAWSASGMFGTLQQALDRILSGTQRPYLGSVLVNLMSVAGIAGLVVLSVAASTVLRLLVSGVIRLIGHLPGPAGAALYLLPPLGLSYLAFLLVYRFIPTAPLRGRPLHGAALLAALGFELAKAGFSLYAANFGRFQVVYGALGGVVAFLFFVYVVSIIILYVAALAAVRARPEEAANERQ